MKVLAIAQSLEPKSGWGRYAYSVLGEFKRLNIPYIAAAFVDKGEKPEVALSAATALGFLRNCLACRKAARSCDIVHAFDCWPFAVYGWAAVIGTRKKLFITGVGTYSVEPFNSLRKRLLLVPACRRALRIFTIADYTKRRMLEKTRLTNIETVFWGTSPIAPPTPEEVAHYREKFSIQERHPLLLTVGDVKNRKGQFDTLKALEKIKSTYPNMLYVTVGFEDPPGYGKAMREFAAMHGMEENLRMIGGVRDDCALAFFYSIADLFVMNSNNEGDHFEGFGLVFLEAEQFGVPVIGSRDCGIEQALEDGYNGYLTKQGDADDIAEKIKHVLAGDRKTLGEHSKEFASRFSWEKMVATYLAAYRA